jgi:cell division protein FtsX
VNEKDFENRSQEFYGAPDGYVRRESIFKTIGAAVGILGAILGIVGLNNAYREYVDRLITNERNERINQDNRFEQRLYDCCRRR